MKVTPEVLAQVKKDSQQLVIDTTNNMSDIFGNVYNASTNAVTAAANQTYDTATTVANQTYDTATTVANQTYDTATTVANQTYNTATTAAATVYEKATAATKYINLSSLPLLSMACQIGQVGGGDVQCTLAPPYSFTFKPIDIERKFEMWKEFIEKDCNECNWCIYYIMSNKTTRKVTDEDHT